jgi:hypothetical protein
MQMRIFIPEFAMRDVHLGASVRALIRGQARPLTGTLAAVSADVTATPPGLLAKEQLQGIRAPRFYLGAVYFVNNGQLQDGSTGLAKIFVRRRSLAEFAWRFAADLVQRRLW